MSMRPPNAVIEDGSYLREVAWGRLNRELQIFRRVTVRSEALPTRANEVELLPRFAPVGSQEGAFGIFVTIRAENSQRIAMHTLRLAFRVACRNNCEQRSQEQRSWVRNILIP